MHVQMILTDVLGVITKQKLILNKDKEIQKEHLELFSCFTEIRAHLLSTYYGSGIC